MPTLYEDWLTDQTIGFAANWLISDPEVECGADLFEAAGKLIEQAVPNLDGLSVPTLSLIASIPEGNPRKFDSLDGFDISGAQERASRLIGQLAGKDAQSTALAAHAALILQQDHVSFEGFLRWAYRASPRVKAHEDSATGWNHTIWSQIHKNLTTGNKFKEVEAALRKARNHESRLNERIIALNDLYQKINDATHFRTDHPHIQPWIRFSKYLVSRQFCWPLMVSDMGGALSGISLPISTFLSPDEKSKVYFKDGNRRHTRFIGKSPSEFMYGFEEGCLRWNGDWYKAFVVGLETAKELWAAQNGRLADNDQKRRKLTSSLVVDLSHANAIVTRFYAEANNSGNYRLTGRSAEAYLVQVALGLMLPDGAKPDGVATGMVSHQNGFFRLLPVEGPQEKLRYANNSAQFSRIVLPEDEQTREQTHDGVKDSGQARLVEINYCPSARSAADAMQSSGWRRAHFFRTPAVQRSFYQLLYKLFQLDNSRNASSQERENADDYLPQEERDRRIIDPLPEHEIRKLRKLSNYLISHDYTVKYCKRSDVDFDEELLGKWLAWIDHQVRGGYGGEPGPGLGVVCMRTSERDNEMRFWSALFGLLKANPIQWEKFQWADLEKAAGLLASLLNNFQADRSISSSPAPDILVVIDDAGYTQPSIDDQNNYQRPTNKVFPDDFRGQLFDLLNPMVAKQPYYLANALKPLDESRTKYLNKTRVIVIYDEPHNNNKKSPEALTTLQVDEGLRRLSIFRASFTVQSAATVLQHDSSPLEDKEQVIVQWQGIRAQLDGWVRNHRLYQHRGHYYMDHKLRGELLGFSEHQNPQLHFAAARSLAPIIQPHHLFLASNRDRAMEPEQLAEAMWHLLEARKHTEPKDTMLRPKIQEAIASLTLLRPDPDWDTVKLLVSMGRRDEGYSLAMELLNKEHASGRTPHTSRYALAINTIGGLARSIKDNPEMHNTLLNKADRLYNIAKPLANAGGSSALQQRTKLSSEYAYCLRSNLRNNDDQGRETLLAEEAELEGSLNELLKARRIDGTDTPISREWLAAKWDDDNLSNVDQAKFARYACELHMDGWDIPWLVQLAKMSLEFETPQVARVLNNWANVYRGETEAFFRRIAGLTPKRLKELPVTASLHLLQFLTRPDDPLQGLPSNYAEDWIAGLSKAITPYAAASKKDKSWRNRVIFEICLLLGKRNVRGLNLHEERRELSESMLHALGVREAWLFVLASKGTLDHANAHALPLLLSNVPDDTVSAIKANKKLGGVVSMASNNLGWWLKEIRWKHRDYKHILAIQTALSAE